MGGLRTIRKRISDEQVRRSLFRVLEENVLCSISTVAPRNRAHVNTAYFCYSPDLELYFLSDPNSLHCRNVASNPSMAVTVFSSSQEWGEPDRGIQLFGTCRPARARRAKEAERLYARRFPRYSKWMAGKSKDDKLRASQLRSYRFYRFVPRAVKILDERVFGGGVFVLVPLTVDATPKTHG